MDQITQLLQQLATQLGVSVEYLWPYLVRYTFVNSVSSVVVNLIGAVIYGLFVYLSIKVLRAGWGKDMSSKDHDSPSGEFFMVVGGLVGMFLFGFLGGLCLEHASQYVAGVFVPEAQAVFDILAKLKTATK